MFLEKQPKLLLAAPLGTGVANICETTVYSILNINH